MSKQSQPSAPSAPSVPTQEISAADWEATPPSVRALVLTLLPLRELVLTLQEQVAELQARANQHSGNSSRPPSSDPPQAPVVATSFIRT